MFCRTNVALNGFQTLVALERLCHLVTLKTKLKTFADQALPVQDHHCGIPYLSIGTWMQCRTLTFLYCY